MKKTNTLIAALLLLAPHASFALNPSQSDSTMTMTDTRAPSIDRPDVVFMSSGTSTWRIALLALVLISIGFFGAHVYRRNHRTSPLQ